jgi:hypothetical protein
VCLVCCCCCRVFPLTLSESREAAACKNIWTNSPRGIPNLRSIFDHLRWRLPTNRNSEDGSPRAAAREFSPAVTRTPSLTLTVRYITLDASFRLKRMARLLYFCNLTKNCALDKKYSVLYYRIAKYLHKIITIAIQCQVLVDVMPGAVCQCQYSLSSSVKTLESIFLK